MNHNHQCTDLHTTPTNGAISCGHNTGTPTPDRKHCNNLSICCRRTRRSHRHRLKSPTRRFFLALCSVFISASICIRSYAFSMSPSTYQSRISTPSSSLCSDPLQPQRYSAGNTRFCMSAILEPPSQSSPAASSSRLSDFQRRMKGIVKRNGVANGRKTVGGSSRPAVERPSNLKVVHTLEEYKDQLDASNGKMVVVRFFATWCKV